MHVDATAVEVRNRRAAAQIVRAIREALQPVESRLQRIHVDVRSSHDRHVCRLRAWAERGQTIVIESSAASRQEAIAVATDSLKGTLKRRWAPLGLRDGRRLRDDDPVGVAHAGDTLIGASRSPSKPDACSSLRASACSGGRVLLALHDLDASSAALHWARVLAEALEADLAVCRVVLDTPATESLHPGQAWLDATRRSLAAARRCEAASDAEPSRVGHGVAAPGHDAALLARQRQVDWIMMPAGYEGCGTSAVALARGLGCPVLVARPPTTRSTLLVATDGSTDNYRILARAALLSEALLAPVLAFHDVGASVFGRTSEIDALTRPWARIQEERRKASGPQRLPDLDVLLAHGSDRVETILQQARREDAEIILVGIADAISPIADRRTAAVVDRSVRSVLLVPPTDTAQSDEIVAAARGAHRSRGISPPGPRLRRWQAAGAKRPLHRDQRRWRSG